METTAQWNTRLDAILADYQTALDDMLLLFDGNIVSHQRRMDTAWQTAQDSHPQPKGI